MMESILKITWASATERRKVNKYKELLVSVSSLLLFNICFIDNEWGRTSPFYINNKHDERERKKLSGWKTSWRRRIIDKKAINQQVSLEFEYFQVILFLKSLIFIKQSNKEQFNVVGHDKARRERLLISILKFSYYRILRFLSGRKEELEK